MKHFALPALALTLATSAAAQPTQDSDRTVTADQAAYGEVRVNDIAPCPRGQPSFSSVYNFPIRFQAAFQNDRYAVILGQSGALVQPGQSLSYTTEITDRAREGMTISVNLRCNVGSRMLVISYAAIGKR